MCFRWNSHGGCYLVNCKFLHCCIRCRDTSHTAIECPRKPNPPTRPPDQPPIEGNFGPPPPVGGDSILQGNTSSHTLSPTDSCSTLNAQKANQTLFYQLELDGENIELDYTFTSGTSSIFRELPLLPLYSRPIAVGRLHRDQAGPKFYHPTTNKSPRQTPGPLSTSRIHRGL